jgi:pimeloyl-ACP methyl ester carboxylesterase
MTELSLTKSTIDRTKIQATRAVFGGLEHLAPSLGARLAEPTWFRLPPPPSVDYSDFPVGAEHFSVRWQGRLVHGYRWGDGPVVYLVHGWGGNAGQFASFVEPLLKAGFSVVTFDAPSHGRSDAGAFGRHSTTAVEMGQALDAVVAQQGQPDAVVAHSMGGIATALSIRDGWVSVPRLVLISPMVALGSHVQVLSTYLGFGERTGQHLKQRALRRVGLTVDELDLNTLFDSGDRPSLLVVHDRGDREASYPASVALTEGWHGSELITTTRLGHRRILDDIDVFRKVAGYLRSGASRRIQTSPGR